MIGTEKRQEPRSCVSFPLLCMENTIIKSGMKTIERGRIKSRRVVKREAQPHVEIERNRVGEKDLSSITKEKRK